MVKRAKKVTEFEKRRINCCKWHKDKPSANIVTLENWLMPTQ
jgi:hypothetical protein